MEVLLRSAYPDVRQDEDLRLSIVFGLPDFCTLVGYADVTYRDIEIDRCR